MSLAGRKAIFLKHISWLKKVLKERVISYTSYGTVKRKNDLSSYCRNAVEINVEHCVTTAKFERFSCTYKNRYVQTIAQPPHLIVE